MIVDNLQKFKWGFFFIMIGFRIQGFDIFPDIIGYIFFAIAFSNLKNSSDYFAKAFNFNLPLIFISLFSIYQAPSQQEGIQLGPWGGLGIFISIVSFILNLMTVYYLFKGIRELEESFDDTYLANEAERRWNHYLILQTAMLLSFMTVFIPVFAFLYMLVILFAAIGVLIGIINFLRRCIDSVNPAP